MASTIGTKVTIIIRWLNSPSDNEELSKQELAKYFHYHLLAIVILPLFSFAQAQQPQTPPRRNPPRAPPSPRRAPPPSVSVEPTPAPVIAPSPPPVVAPSQPPTVAPTQPPTPSGGSQCPRENVIALNVCAQLDLSTLLNNPTKAMQDCCPPINSLSSTIAAGCLCEAAKINFGVTADVLFLEAVLSVCGKAELGNLGCFL
uniref:Hydrophobic seed protein domain-containing protein n=1 Tax=Oryza barthii TaxID=65489 RepID=A0A0D3HUD9_9ORYZ